MAKLRRIPTFDEMLWPTLEALKNTDGSASNQELLTRIVQIMGLPEEIQNLPHGDGPKTEVEYRMYWARTYLRKVGAIQNSERGVWSITTAGRALTESDTKSVVHKVRELVRKERKQDELDDAVTMGVLPEESWQDQLLSVL